MCRFFVHGVAAFFLKVVLAGLDLFEKRGHLCVMPSSIAVFHFRTCFLFRCQQLVPTALETKSGRGGPTGPVTRCFTQAGQIYYGEVKEAVLLLTRTIDIHGIRHVVTSKCVHNACMSDAM